MHALRRAGIHVQEDWSRRKPSDEPHDLHRVAVRDHGECAGDLIGAMSGVVGISEAASEPVRGGIVRAARPSEIAAPEVRL